MSIRSDFRCTGTVGTADFSPYPTVHDCSGGNNCPGVSASDRYLVVSSPARFNSKAWRIHVQDGWAFSGSSGERTELVNANFASGSSRVNPQCWEGSVVWRGESWQFPTSYPTLGMSPGHAEVFQYKGSDQRFPITSVESFGNRITFRIRGGEGTGGSGLAYGDTWVLFNPIPRDVWIDVKWGVRYSVNDEGWVYVAAKLSDETSWTEYADTRPANLNHPTLNDNWSETFYNERSGIYRDAFNSGGQDHYMTGFVVATTDADIDGIWGADEPPTLSITTTSLVGGTVGQSYSQTVQATGGVPPRTWGIASGSLPQGLSFSSGGVISGIPQGPAGTSTFTVRVTDDVLTQVTRQLSIGITAAPPVNILDITTTELPDAEINASYSQPLQAIGGMTPYVWSLEGTGAPQTDAYWLTDVEIQEVANSINDSATPWVAAAYAVVKSAADSALSTSPNPADGSPTTYSTDSTASCTGSALGWRTCLYTPGQTDGNRARNCALVYRILNLTSPTQAAQYATIARNICMAWANTYTPLPARSSIGHYVAEPLGPVIKLALAYMLTKSTFSSTQQTTFQNWIGGFVSRGQLNCDHGVDDTTDPFWGATDTIGTETQRSNAWGNNTSWQRAMVVVAAAAVGGTTLTDALDWNWSHNTAGGRSNGWSTFISNHIASTGETFEGRRRQSLGYGNWSIWAGALIADIAKHAGFHTDLFNYVTSSDNSLLQPWLFYGAAIQGGAWPYGGADPFMSGATQDTIRRNYRSAAELGNRNASSSAIKTRLGTIVTAGGNTARGQNNEAHVIGNNALMSQAFNLSTGGTGSLPPGLSFDSSGSISGTPNTLGAYPFGVKVTDNVGATDSQGLAIDVVDNPDPPPPPPPITPTDPDDFGRDAVSASTLLSVLQPNVIIGSKYSLTQRRGIPRLWAYLSGIGDTVVGTALFLPGIYADDAGGLVPGTLLYQYEEISITGGSVTAFYSAPRGVVPELNAGTYWLAGHAGGNEVAQFGYEPIVDALKRASSVYTGTLPSPYPVPSNATGELVIYAEQTVPTIANPKAETFTDSFDSLNTTRWVVVE